MFYSQWSERKVVAKETAHVSVFASRPVEQICTLGFLLKNISVGLNRLLLLSNVT